MRHAWSALAQNSFVDRETGLVSLIGLVEEITGTSLEGQPPAAPPDTIPIGVHLVSQFWRSDLSRPETGQVRVRIHGAAGQVECSVDLLERKRQNVIIKISGIPYFGQGVYRCEIEESADGRWHPMASAPFEVRPQPATPSSSPSDA